MGVVVVVRAPGTVVRRVRVLGLRRVGRRRADARSSSSWSSRGNVTETLARGHVPWRSSAVDGGLRGSPRAEVAASRDARRAALPAAPTTRRFSARPRRTRHRRGSYPTRSASAVVSGRAGDRLLDRCAKPVHDRHELLLLDDERRQICNATPRSAREMTPCRRAAVTTAKPAVECAATGSASARSLRRGRRCGRPPRRKLGERSDEAAQDGLERWLHVRRAARAR